MLDAMRRARLALIVLAVALLGCKSSRPTNEPRAQRSPAPRRADTAPEPAAVTRPVLSNPTADTFPIEPEAEQPFVRRNKGTVVEEDGSVCVSTASMDDPTCLPLSRAEVVQIRAEILTYLASARAQTHSAAVRATARALVGPASRIKEPFGDFSAMWSPRGPDHREGERTIFREHDQLYLHAREAGPKELTNDNIELHTRPFELHIYMERRAGGWYATEMRRSRQEKYKLD